MEPLEVTGPNDAKMIDRTVSGIARYAPILPVDPENLLTLGAGQTPLVEGTIAGQSVFFKLDSLLPTGSFKDRGAAVSVSLLASNNARRIVVDSSGNAAAAMSAYCAAHGIECVVYAPASASPAKLIQSQAYGAEVRLIDGPREAVASAAQAAGEADAAARYVSHNWSPIFAEGVKTWAVEVWEQLGQQAPARVFVPTGGGSALVGALRGFQATGVLPRIIAAQPAACAPLATAFELGERHLAAATPGETIAEGARISAPPRDHILTEALRMTQGAAVAIEENELIAALKELWNQGIYAEPTAGLGAAAFARAAMRGDDLAGTNVILITGSGLKSTDTIGTLLSSG
jgi:threonine synthase